MKLPEAHIGKRRTAGRCVIAYSAVFVLMAGVICLYFGLTGRSFVRGSDAYSQHLRALIYYSRWLRALFSNLFSGNFSVPAFSFSLGYGGDILTTLHHYGLGEPLCFLSVFVPEEGMIWFYSALSLLRMYLAGLSFLAFVLYRKRFAIGTEEAENKTPKGLFPALGALTYVFAAYPVMFGLQHPVFLSAFILFPLILLGIERVIRENRPAVFVLSVFLSGLSSFYFLYMMAILAVIWYLLRRLPLKEGFRMKDFLAEILRLLLYGGLGLSMAAVIFLPVVLSFLSDARNASHSAFHFLYPSAYYKGVLQAAVSSDYLGSAYGTLGFGALFIPALAMLALRAKRHSRLLLALLLMAVGFLLPVFGYFMNGFAYVVNRWLFAFCFGAGVLVSEMSEEFAKASLRDVLISLLLSVLYTGAAILLRFGATERFGYQLIFLGIFFVLAVFFAALKDRPFLKKAAPRAVPVFSAALLLLGAASLLVNDLVYFKQTGIRSIRDFVSEEGTTEDTAFWENDALLVQKSGEEGFFRFTTDDPERAYENSTVLYDRSSTQYYWSMSNPYVSRFMTDLCVSDPVNLADCYHGLDGRTDLLLLTGVRLSLAKEGTKQPYSYEQSGDADAFTGLSVYRTEQALPFAYTCQDTITEEAFLDLPPIERQQMLLHAAVTESGASGGNASPDLSAMAETTLDLSLSEIDDLALTVTETAQDRVSGVKVEAQKKNASLTLQLSDSADCETYLYVTGLRYEPGSRKGTEPTRLTVRVIFMAGETVVSGKTIVLRTAYDKWGKGQTDYLVNSCCHEETVDRVRIIFPETGTYSFDSISAVSLDPSGAVKQAALLREDPVEAVSLHDSMMPNVTDEVSFRITLREEKTVVTQIPYGKGWKVYADGEEAELRRLNVMFTGLTLGEGTHEIVFRYRTPGLTAGLILSLLSTAGFIFLLVFKKMREKKREENREENEASSVS